MASVGAEGIGLYRTEIPFLVRREYPDVEAQTRLYRRVLQAAGDRPVTFRTLDAGGDKRLPSFHHEPEENPALGWRARSEEHTSELQSLMRISYAVFCLKKKKDTQQ